MLSLLQPEPRYGFELVQLLSQAGGLLANEGTIYPLLGRLRSTGMVTTEWQESKAGPPRRYYKLSLAGQRALDNFRQEWSDFQRAVDQVLRGGK